MTYKSLDELEMDLRVLGRQSGSAAPSGELIKRTQAASAAQLALCSHTASVYQQRRLMIRLAALLALTFPIPLLFLWGDWAAASALFGRVLSPEASGVVSTVYLWIKFCAISLIYVVAIPGLFWVGMRLNAAGQMPEEMSGT